MKKILLTLMTLCCLSTAWAGTGDITPNAGGYIEVTSSDEFVAAISANNSARIKLVADIDVSNLGTICDTFSGQIYGKYQYTTDDGVLRDTVYTLEGAGRRGGPLFNKIDHASIEYVLLHNFRVEGTTDYLGAWAKTASNSTFNFALMKAVDVSSSVDHVGGMLGKAENCTFENISIVNSSVKTTGVEAGGFVGESYGCVYTNCRNNMRCNVFADGATLYNYSRAGGYCGHSTNDKFTDCLNTAIVGGNDDTVGGFAGRSDGSDYYLCTNSGSIVHAAEKDFDKLVAEIYSALGNMINDFSAIQYVISGASVVIGSLAGGLAGYAVYFLLEGIGFAEVLAVTAIFGVFAAVATAVVVSGVLAANQLSQHDEIGGLCGYAIGGQFSLCSNRGYINCRDSQGGGIIGRAEGVTVNNCLNSQECQWGDDDCGSIIGQASAGCKVTNCLSTLGYPVVGAASDMSTESGNNYSLNAGENGWEMPVTEEQLKSGIVTHWLNNGAENRKNGVKPWRQNLGENGDGFPILEADHAVVNVEDLIEFEIATPQQLVDFAQHVNEGNQFATACLLSDIDMTGVDFTPIGKNEANKHFRGLFDGRGHTIKGLRVEIDSDNNGAGLFGTVHSNAEILNVIVDRSCEFTNTKDGGAAGIVGLFYTGWNWSEMFIENCANQASVNGNKHAGGILGRVMTGEDGGPSVRVYINNCCNIGTITATNGMSGLLCGYTKNHGHISNCWSAGELKSANAGNKPFDATHHEFFAGYDSKIDIKNCYAIDAHNKVQNLDMREDQEGVTRWLSSDLYNGSLTYNLNGCDNDATHPLTWQQNLGTDSYPVFGSQGVFHTREVTTEIGTVCLPYALQSDDAVSYYAFSGASTDEGQISLNFEFVETTTPGQPVLFRMANTGNFTFSDAVGNSWANAPLIPADAEWVLCGTYQVKEYTTETAPSSETIYYVSNGAIKNAKKVTINPYRAYFEGPNIETLKNGSNGARVRIVIDGEDNEASALQLVADDIVTRQNAKAYTLYGTEAGEGHRGLLIRGGKKEFIGY